MKKFLALLITIASIWYVVTTYNQMSLIRQTRERLSEAEQHLTVGKFKAANSLLIQAELDLNSLDQFYTFPAVRQRQQELHDVAQGVRSKFTQRLKEVRVILDKAISLLKAGDVKKALDTVEGSLKQVVNQDSTLLYAAQYLKRLNAQDFKGAEEAVAAMTAELPQEFNVEEIANLLTEFVQSDRKANRETQVRIATEVRPLVNVGTTRDSSSFTPTLKGRAMVWDFTKNEADQAYELLPDALRASSRDGTITMFLIVKRENIVKGYYSVSRQPAYQEKVTLGVVYWPQKVSPGTVIVMGEPPPSVRPVKYAPEYGTAVNISNWVAKLPHE